MRSDVKELRSALEALTNTAKRLETVAENIGRRGPLYQTLYSEIMYGVGDIEAAMASLRSARSAEREVRKKANFGGSNGSVT